MAGDLFAERYRLLEPLSRGAMSAVWLAEDEELGRRVAVKTLAPAADRARFDREAKAVAALSHPNICALYDYGEVEGRPFMALEYLAGGTLEERLPNRRPLRDDETAAIAVQVAAGLAHAHAHGLVHHHQGGLEGGEGASGVLQEPAGHGHAEGPEEHEDHGRRQDDGRRVAALHDHGAEDGGEGQADPDESSGIHVSPRPGG